jgi:DnaK suppressor protein
MDKNPTQDELRDFYHQEIETLKSSIQGYKEAAKPVAPDDAYGRVSRMDAINNKSVMELSLRQAEVRLSKLERMAEKIGTKAFGKCIKCGKAIPIGRIMAMPESSKCISCAR